MNLSIFSDSVFDVAFFAAGRLRRLAFAALIAVGLYPHLANGTGVKADPFEIEFRSERSFAVNSNMNPFKLNYYDTRKHWCWNLNLAARKR